MKALCSVIIPVFLALGTASACDFQTEAAAARILYRSDGWILPGLSGGRLSAPAPLATIPEGPGGRRSSPAPVPGLTLRIIIHNDESNVLQFPRQVFEQEGKPRAMRQQAMLLERGWIYRYDAGGHIVAYTYGLTPVVATKVDGKWKIEDEVGCVFFATFVDDKGDGVFRQLIPGAMTPDLIPQWALEQKKQPI